MIAREDGPFDAFMLLRELIGQEKWLGRGLHCVLCISFWLSLPAALLVGLPWLIGLPILSGWLVSWLGIAGGVMVLHLIFNGGL